MPATPPFLPTGSVDALSKNDLRIIVKSVQKTIRSLQLSRPRRKVAFLTGIELTRIQRNTHRGSLCFRAANEIKAIRGVLVPDAGWPLAHHMIYVADVLREIREVIVGAERVQLKGDDGEEVVAEYDLGQLLDVLAIRLNECATGLRAVVPERPVIVPEMPEAAS